MRFLSRAFAIVGAVLLSGCGAWTVVNAQEALMVGAEVTEDIDNEIAPTVTQAITRCDETHEFREDFVECMDPFMPLRHGVRLTRASLSLGQSAVDGWRSGVRDDSAWIEVAACIGEGLGIIAREVRVHALDVTISDVFRWLDLFGAIAGNVCPDELLESERFRHALEAQDP